MNIREATPQDIPDIVRVLKASLGEDELALSEDVWKYKHINNPFGESIVLVAEEGARIAGVRAFMRWKWQINTKEFIGFRAVDTSTHPDFQGKGIFKKLTLQAVHQAKESGGHLIFNTPNEQSRPGYLKMGWNIVGKINVGLKPSFSFLWNLNAQQEYSVNLEQSSESLEELCKTWNNKLKAAGKVFTPKNLQYLKWRYQNNPLQKYEIHYSNGIYLAGYVKRRKGLKEFRVSEFLFDKEKLAKNDLSGFVKKVERKFGCHLISFAPHLVPLSGKKGFFGPVLTLNGLNLSKSEESLFSDINNWENSLGDLELY